jgi:hypothetical protein
MMWLSHGARMVLVAGPGPVTLAVYLSGQPPQALGEFDAFDGGMCCPASSAPSGASSGGGSSVATQLHCFDLSRVKQVRRVNAFWRRSTKGVFSADSE